MMTAVEVKDKKRYVKRTVDWTYMQSNNHYKITMLKSVKCFCDVRLEVSSYFARNFQRTTETIFSPNLLTKKLSDVVQDCDFAIERETNDIVFIIVPQSRHILIQVLLNFEHEIVCTATQFVEGFFQIAASIGGGKWWYWWYDGTEYLPREFYRNRAGQLSARVVEIVRSSQNLFLGRMNIFKTASYINSTVFGQLCTSRA